MKKATSNQLISRCYFIRKNRN